MNLVEVIDHYIERCLDGFPIDKVREELEAQNYSEEDIWFIVREVDNYLLNNKVTGQQQMTWKAVRMSGMILMLVGMGIWFATYAGLINMGGYYLLPYGIILSGAAMYYGVRWLV